MARCEDWPCCGHESGCCPDFDQETGEQLNMVCTCGAKLPLTSRYSICRSCLDVDNDEGNNSEPEYEDCDRWQDDGRYDE